MYTDRMNITFKYSTYNSRFRSLERKSKIEKIYGFHVD